MARRTRVRLCEKQCGRPVRKRRGARFCSPCVGRMPKKTCLVCGGAFAPDMTTGPRCRPCASQTAHAKRIEQTYGLTAQQYAQLLEYQQGACFICRRKPVSKRLAVDHNHQTGDVRGLLCRACNRDILGHLRDDVEALARAIDYLTATPAKRLWGDAVPKQPVEAK